MDAPDPQSLFTTHPAVSARDQPMITQGTPLNTQGDITPTGFNGSAEGEESEGESHEGEEEDGEDDESHSQPESGDEDEEEEETFPPVEDPSTDIRGDLENALKGGLDFKGSFRFEKVHPDAPNPLLRLDGLGHIGLPLSEAEAKRIIPFCQQAPFGKGERTIIDTTVRDTWEMDASKVHFDGPGWSAFMAKTVIEVCVGLGVDAGVSQPRCELYKFLLYEKGSHFLPHQDTEKVDGMFATIIIILPSQFTGGEAHLSHSGVSTAIDVAPTSLWSTSVLSWYTDVTHEIKPIQSGYRLALSYNLIHSTNTLKPRLSDTSSTVTRLRHIFGSWRQDLEDAPQKIIYLLDHKYSLANMRGNALKGSDAHRVALLQALGDEFGFRLGLASIECNESGAAENDYGGGYGGGSRWGRCRYDDYDDDDMDPADLEFAEDVEREMSITNLVDLGGRMLTATLDLGDEDECIPLELQDMVESGVPDDQEYEGYQGNYAGNLTRWYRRTALVIWPAAYEHSVILGLSHRESTLREINTSTSKKPSKKELKLVEDVLRMAQQDVGFEGSVLRAVCRAAARWVMLDLWLRAFSACHGSKNVAQMGVVLFSSAIETFVAGIQAIGPSIEKTLENEPSNTMRLTLLSTLKPALGGKKLLAFQQWIYAQRKAMLLSLRPLVGQDVLFVVDAARLVGELPVLESLVSQAKATASPVNLLALSTEISKDTPNQLLKSEDGMAVKHRIVTDLLTQVILKTDYFATPPAPPVQVSYPYYLGSYRPQPTISPTLALQHLKECLQTDNVGLTAVIAERLTSTEALLTADIAQSRATLVLIPLLPRLKELAGVRGVSVATVPGFRILYQKTVPLMLDALKTRPLSDEDIALIFEAADMSGALQFIAESVVPKIKALCGEPSSIMRFIRKLKPHQVNFPAPPPGLPSVSSMVEQLVKSMVRRAPHAQTAGAQATISIMEFAYEVGHPAVCGDILSRLFLNEPSPLSANYISKILVPSITDLMAFLARRHIAPTTAPFASYFKKVVFGCVDLVLGRRPPDMTASLASARRISCGCASCRQVVAFFTSSPAASMTLSRIGAPAVKHVEAELRRSCGSAVAQCRTLTTTPRSLEVIKTAPMHNHLKWESQRTATIQLIKKISVQEPVLLELFGPTDYRRLLQSVGFTGINTVLTAAQFAAVPLPAVGPSVARSRGQVTATVAISPTAYNPLAAAPALSSRMGVAVPHQPAASSSAHAPPAAPGLPPKKKRKTDNMQVIDLTSP